MSTVPEGLLVEPPEAPAVVAKVDPLPPAPTSGRYAAGTIRQIVVASEPVPPAAALPATVAPVVDAKIDDTPASAAEPSPAIMALASAAAAVSDSTAVATQADPPPAGGTVVTEVPSGAEVVAINSGVAELRWTGTVVQARPATTADIAPVRAMRFEVSNGNGITGLARKVARLFADIGAPRARLTNHRPFAQRISVVQYRAGYRDEALALSARLPGQPEVVAAGSLRAGVDVRLVLGYDVPRDVALLPGPDMQASRTERRSSQATDPR
jgi:hypothetical protein